MFELLNTLYILTPGASLHLDHDAVRVVIDRETRLRTPLLRLDSIVTFGRIAVSPLLIHRCADDGRAIIFMSGSGRFKARLVGPVRGNVLLRRSQHIALDTHSRPSLIARQFVAGKIQNSRLVLLRGARDSTGEPSDVRGADILSVDSVQVAHAIAPASPPMSSVELPHNSRASSKGSATPRDWTLYAAQKAKRRESTSKRSTG